MKVKADITSIVDAKIVGKNILKNFINKKTASGNGEKIGIGDVSKRN